MRCRRPRQSTRGPPASLTLPPALPRVSCPRHQIPRQQTLPTARHPRATEHTTSRSLAAALLHLRSPVTSPWEVTGRHRRLATGPPVATGRRRRPATGVTGLLRPSATLTGAMAASRLLRRPAWHKVCLVSNNPYVTPASKYIEAKSCRRRSWCAAFACNDSAVEHSVLLEARDVHACL